MEAWSCDHGDVDSLPTLQIPSRRRRFDSMHQQTQPTTKLYEW
jgi:hypothetical protein